MINLVKKIKKDPAEIHRILEKCKAFENLRFSMCKN
jgi:hypothetical protein